MTFTFDTRGTCSTRISFNYENGRIESIRFTGGCNGNLKAISKLCEGMNADELIEKLSGNTCGSKPTSCADQLAKAVAEAKKSAAENNRT